MVSHIDFDPDIELALVRGVLAEEEPAIREFAERLRCVPRILAAENRRRGKPLDEHDLADLVQDSVVVVLGKIDDYAGAAPLEGWISRVCRLEFMNSLRRKWRRADRGGTTVDELGDAAPSVHPDVSARDAVHFALEQLETSDAELVRMKHFLSLTFVEMAERLELSPNTCKTRYYRALTQLERALRRECDA